MPHISVKSLKPQEDKIKIEEKKEVVKINQKVKAQTTEPKPFNPFKDIKLTKGKDKEPDELKSIKKDLEIEQFLSEQKKKLIENKIQTAEGKVLYDHAYKLMASPERDLYKREIFENRLKSNPAIKDYVEQHMVFNVLHRVNHNLRFLLHYGIEWNQSHEDFKKWRLIQDLSRETHLESIKTPLESIKTPLECKKSGLENGKDNLEIAKTPLESEIKHLEIEKVYEKTPEKREVETRDNLTETSEKNAQIILE
jgi:hypothetical protein